MIKKTIPLVVLLLVSISAFTQVDRSKQPKSGPTPTIKLDVPTEFTLKNGLNVLVVENHKLPRVSYALTLNNTPITEGSKTGVSTLLGMMLGNGTNKTPKDNFNEEVDFLGAKLSYKSNSAYASGLSKYAPRILDLMAEALTNPLLAQETFNSKKEHLLKSLKSKEKNIGVVANRVGKALSFGKNHPFGEFITEETINNITLDNIKTYYKNYFIPNDAYLVIVGDINSKEIEKQVRKLFKKWNKGAYYNNTIKRASPNVKATEINFVNMPNAVQSNISLTNNISLKMKDQDYHTALITNQILGGGFSSYLNMNLRESKGWTYGARSNFNISRHNSSRFTTNTQVRNTVTDSTITETLKEINRIRDEIVTPKALAIAKAKYVGDFVLALENPKTIANYALNIKLHNLPKDFYKNYLSKINQVTAKDIQAVANKYLKPENSRIIVIGKGNDAISGLEKMGINIKYFDSYANKTEKPELTKSITKNITAQSILDKYIKVIGGKKNISTIKTLKMEGEATIEDFPLNIKAEIKLMLPNKESFILTNKKDKILLKQKWDGNTGHIEYQGLKKNFSNKENANKKGIKVAFPETNLNNDNTSLESIVTINGKDNYKLKSEIGTNTTYRYYNINTGLLTKTSEIKKEANRKTITFYSDYKQVNNLLLPHKQKIINEEQNMTIVLKKITTNKEVTDLDFK